MKLFIAIFMVLSLVGLVKGGSINLTPYDDAQYGNYFNDKNNILTVNPEEFHQNPTPTESMKPSGSPNENYMDPSFKAVLQDISDNSHLVSLENKDEARFLAKNKDYQRSIDDSVNSEMDQISRETKEEELRNKNQEMAADLYLPELGHRSTSNFLKAPRFLEKTESQDAGVDESQIYDPSEAGVF